MGSQCCQIIRCSLVHSYFHSSPRYRFISFFSYHFKPALTSLLSVNDFASYFLRKQKQSQENFHKLPVPRTLTDLCSITPGTTDELSMLLEKATPPLSSRSHYSKNPFLSLPASILLLSLILFINI